MSMADCEQTISKIPENEQFFYTMNYLDIKVM
jgi:hypothetical protein